MADPEDQVNPDTNAETTRREATRDPTELVPVYENARVERETSLEPPSDTGITVDPATLNGQFKSTVEVEALPPIETQGDEATTTTAPAEETTTPDAETASADNEDTATAGTESAETEGVDTVPYEVPFTPAGYTTDPTPGKKQGRKMHTNIPQQSMGDAFNQLIYLLSLLFNDPEMFPFAVDQLYPEDVYIDPADRERTTEDRNRRIEALREVVEDPDHPDRQLSPRDFVDRHFGLENMDNLKPHIARLMGVILDQESNGNPNILWDYRNRTQPGRNWPGLQPGDTTPGGLRVPEFTNMTVNQVMAWQRQYLQEQIDAGIPANRRSTAVGTHQFVLTTLREMVREGRIDGNMKFDESGQLTAAVSRMEWRIERAVNGSGGTFESRLRQEFMNEWEGLKSPSVRAQLNEAISAIAADSNPTVTMLTSDAPSPGR